jgi:hypothetical protein
VITELPEVARLDEAVRWLGKIGNIVGIDQTTTQ